MIGSGLKKLAAQHGMQIGNSVAYGSLMGFATTLSEGAGWKRIDIATTFADPVQLTQLQTEVSGVNTSKEYRVQNFGFGPKWISIVFLDNPGTMKRIEAFIQWFYPMLTKYGASGANSCAECGGEVTAGSWYLINGIAYNMHESCADHVIASLQEEVQQQNDEDTGSYVQGFIGALVGALLGSVVWAVVLYLGYVASIVGLLIGWLANKGYDLLHGKQGKGKVAILIIAVILGVLVGTIVPDAIYLGQMIQSGELVGFSLMDIPVVILSLLIEDGEYLTATLSNMGMGLLFAALGAFALIKRTNDEVSGPKMKKLG